MNLKNIKSTMDLNPPTTFGYLKSRAKKDQIVEGKLAFIFIAGQINTSKLKGKTRSCSQRCRRSSNRVGRNLTSMPPDVSLLLFKPV
jgi:hypothetical protein